MSSKKTFLIIDSFALIFRAYYAFPPTLTTKEGQLVNAAYGFTTLLIDVINKFKPTHLVAVYESETPLIRHSDYVLYKANRKETDNELLEQIPIVKEILKSFNIPVLHVNGYEADDVIGTISKNYKRNNLEKIIVTGDQDLFQLIQEDTKIYLAGRQFSKSKLYESEGVQEKLGITPEQVIDYKALCGDPSDNIPGVKGVGKKTAQTLLEEYGTLEEIYKNIDKIKGAVQKKLAEDYEMAIKSQKLATVETNVPLSFDLKTAVFNDLDPKAVTEMLDKYQFKSLRNKVEKMLEEFLETEEDVLPLFANQTVSEDIKLLSFDEKKLQNNKNLYLLSEIDNSDKSPINYQANEVFLADESGNLYSIKEDDYKELVNLITSKEINLISDNIKDFFHVLINKGIDIDDLEKIKFEDIGFATQIFSRAKYGHSLRDIFDFFDLHQSDSAAENTKSLKTIYEQLLNLKEEREELNNVYDLEVSILLLVIKMEQKGITFDNKVMLDFEHKLEKIKEKIQTEIFESVGHEFNINSPRQVGEVLFAEKNLPGARKTKSGQYSTNEQTLKKLTSVDPVVKKILEYREVDKLLSTYVKTLGGYVDNDGRVHSYFDQLGAVSGRFSSNNPNLQNIPINQNLNVNIRNAFVADKNKIFIAFDYSQQELRILAALADEQKMLDGFNKDEDIHKITASQMFDKKPEEVTKKERDIGKTINFSVVYGISSFGLSERMEIDRKEADLFIKKFYKTYPNIKVFFDESSKEIESKKYAVSVLGRKRENLNIKSRQFFVRNAAERELLNFMIQGSAADIMKLAMQKIKNIIKNYKVDLLLQIHDEFVFEFEGSESEREKFKKEICNIMENAYKLGVNYKVDVNEGKNWGELK